MADQFDLEQGIMSCWNVTTDLDILLEELMENQSFTKDQASNFVLGLSTIYQSKFEKLLRDFESFLKEYYKNKLDGEAAQCELDAIIEENEALCAQIEAPTVEEILSLDELFLQEEEQAYEAMMEENDRLDGFMEDENGYFIFPK
jgi:hypothetical protein